MCHVNIFQFLFNLIEKAKQKLLCYIPSLPRHRMDASVLRAENTTVMTYLCLLKVFICASSLLCLVCLNVCRRAREKRITLEDASLDGNEVTLIYEHENKMC